MQTLTCRARQTIEIGENIEIIVLEVAPGVVRLSVHAPHQRITQIDPVALPVGASELGLVHLDAPPPWPRGGRK